jgi:CheY-like chemotaxis protein
MLDEWLQHKGFSVWLACTGQDALGVYRRHREKIDVVLMDIRMPGLDGPETFFVLKTIAPQVCCCFMSGELGHYTEEGLLALGAARIIKKPFCLDELTQVLSSLARPLALEPEAALRAGKS